MIAISTSEPEAKIVARACAGGRRDFVGAGRAEIAAAGRGARGREVLAGEGEHRRPVDPLQRELPALGRLHRVGRAEDAHVRHGAERREMLDRLVGRSVLAEADRIVRHHVDDRDAGERGDAHRRARVVGEDEERRAGRLKPPWMAMPFMAAAMPCSRMP